MSLVNGKFVPRQVRRVAIWAKPDAQGTGEPIWDIKYADNGLAMGKEQRRDQFGNIVKTYPLPEGFKDVPNSDNKSCYVYFENGEIYRTPSGEAVNILPGQAVVFEADGSVTYLEDEYAQYVFGLAHDRVDDWESADES